MMRALEHPNKGICLKPKVWLWWVLWMGLYWGPAFVWRKWFKSGLQSHIHGQNTRCLARWRNCPIRFRDSSHINVRIFEIDGHASTVVMYAQLIVGGVFFRSGIWKVGTLYSIPLKGFCCNSSSNGWLDLNWAMALFVGSMLVNNKWMQKNQDQTDYIDINEKRRWCFQTKRHLKNCCMCINPSNHFTPENTVSVHDLMAKPKSKGRHWSSYPSDNSIIIFHSSRIRSPEITIVNVWSTDRQATLDTTHQFCNWSRIKSSSLHHWFFVCPAQSCLLHPSVQGLTLSVFAATVMVTSFSKITNGFFVKWCR